MLDELRYSQTGLEGQRLQRKSSNIDAGFSSGRCSVLGSVICGQDVTFLSHWYSSYSKTWVKNKMKVNVGRIVIDVGAANSHHRLLLCSGAPGDSITGSLRHPMPHIYPKL